MQILYISLHNLDLTKNEPIRKIISSDFGDFINNYIVETLRSNSSREYTVIDYKRMTLSLISELCMNLIRQDESLSDKDNADYLTDAIAQRLLDTEKTAQNQVKGIAKIQKGSVIQALVNGEYGNVFVIAKVEHSEWYDSESFVRQFGIPRDKTNVWKSAVIKLSIIDEKVDFTSIRCYVNTKARYWTDTFLEIKESTSDSTNTRAVMKAFDRVLAPLKKYSPKDYYTLKNTVNHELQTDQLIDYSEMVSRLLDNYSPDSEIVDSKALKEKLLSLIGEKKFDTQFYTDPKELKKLIRIRIPVSPSIEVCINDPQENWTSNFMILRKPDGRNYLMIRCENQNTLASFIEEENIIRIQT